MKISNIDADHDAVTSGHVIPCMHPSAGAEARRQYRQHGPAAHGAPTRRRFPTGWLILALAGSATACVPSDHPPDDLAPVDASMPPDSAEAPDCDGDDDGYYAAHAACDAIRGDAPADCDDSRADVHPHAPVVCGDGVINNCVEISPSTQADVGIQELGLLSADPIFLAPPGDHHTNISIAAMVDATSGPVAVVTAAANSARIVMLDYEAPQSARVITPSYPPDVTYSGHRIEVVRTQEGFRIGALAVWNGGGATYDKRPVFADIAASDTQIAFDMIDATPSCPLLGTPEEYIHDALSPLSEDGTLFFEVVSSDSGATRLFHASPDGLGCQDLETVGTPRDEFGSQLAASGNMAVGLRAGGMWTLEDPLRSEDFHPYVPATTVARLGALLAQDASSGAPVVFAYLSTAGTVAIEALDCSGLEPCRQVRNHELPPADGMQASELRLAPLGDRSALLLSEQFASRDGSSALELRLLDETGAVHDEGLVHPLIVVGGASSGESKGWLDMTTVGPTATRPWHDILIATTVIHSATDQSELRLIRARACNEH